MTRPIVVIAEQIAGKLRPVTFETVAFALEIQRLRPAPIRIVILGAEPERAARSIADAAGLDVLGIRTELAGYNAESYKAVLAPLLAELEAAWICVAHTPVGMDFAPGLAFRLGAVCITGIEAVAADGDRLLFTRAFHNGKMLGDVGSRTDAAVLTVTPGVFKPPAAAVGAGRVAIRQVACPPVRSRTLAVTAAATQESELTSAPVVVAAGRGVDKKENLALIFRLAELFPRAAVAGSRWVCDAGWLPRRRQVGLTGARVAPRLYIACGISGSPQHLAGMRDSVLIAAVNRDPHAAIFNIADVCIVEDLNTFIPAFIREYRKNRQLQ